MKIKSASIFLVIVAVLLFAVAAAFAADSDRDGITNSDEIQLGTDPHTFNPAKDYVDRVVSYNKKSDMMTTYVSRAKKIVAKVDDQTVVYCSDSAYFAYQGGDDPSNQDSGNNDDPAGSAYNGNQDSFGDGSADDNSAECSTDALKPGARTDAVQLSYLHGNTYFDEIDLL